jgi:hypothetical protein
VAGNVPPQPRSCTLSIGICAWGSRPRRRRQAAACSRRTRRRRSSRWCPSCRRGPVEEGAYPGPEHVLLEDLVTCRTRPATRLRWGFPSRRRVDLCSRRPCGSPSVRVDPTGRRSRREAAPAEPRPVRARERGPVWFEERPPMGHRCNLPDRGRASAARRRVVEAARLRDRQDRRSGRGRPHGFRGDRLVGEGTEVWRWNCPRRIALPARTS